MCTRWHVIYNNSCLVNIYMYCETHFSISEKCPNREKSEFQQIVSVQVVVHPLISAIIYAGTIA